MSGPFVRRITDAVLAARVGPHGEHLCGGPDTVPESS